LYESRSPMRRGLAIVIIAVLADVIGARIAGARDALIMWADQSIKISGSNNSFCGWAHSNGTVEVSGTGNTVTGPFEYVASYKGKGTITPLAAPAAAAPAPAHDVAYYRSLAQTEGTYFPANGNLNGNGSTLGGIVFAEGNLQLSASDV